MRMRLGRPTRHCRTLPTDAYPETRLTPGQLFGLQYSRDKYADGSYQVNGGRDPSVTSFYGAIDKAPDGQFMNYPTYWDRQILSPAAALARALSYEKKTGGQFARYPTEAAANWGEMQMVHPIMDQDATRVLATPEAQARLRAMLPPGGR